MTRSEWADYGWWQVELATAIGTTNPALCNLRITLAHYVLSLALHELIGVSSGPNFHTWAVWGSKKAGSTIRREDLPHLRPLVVLGGALVGAGLWRRSRLVGALGAGAGSLRVADALLERASANVLAGNRTVLDDIGHASARFISTFAGRSNPVPALLQAFLATLRPGPASAGGQDLLRDAFTHYYAARHSADPDAKAEHMLFANLKAILHEHQRLQPYIARAMPAPLRRPITAILLRFEAGAQLLNVHQDVLAWQGEDCPPFLQHLDNADLRRFLVGPGGWDRTPDSLLGSRAADWSNIGDRMNYICDLFRYRNFDPSLLAAPYNATQQAQIAAGHIPAGSL